LSHSNNLFLCVGWVFQDRFSWTVCFGWLQTAILLISATWVARITGVSQGWRCGSCGRAPTLYAQSHEFKSQTTKINRTQHKPLTQVWATRCPAQLTFNKIDAQDTNISSSLTIQMSLTLCCFQALFSLCIFYWFAFFLTFLY
jgi:hypothetical protein